MTFTYRNFLGVLASWRFNRICLRKVSSSIAAIILFLSAVPSGIATAATENSPAATAPSTPSQHDLQQWVTQLGSDDPQTRRTALGNLMALNKSDLPALRDAAVSEHSLLPQQIAAIHEAVTQVFLSAQPFKFAADPALDYGFLGIQMMSDIPSQPPDGVLVWSRIPGFVAYRMLQQGDIIVKIIRRPALADIDVHQFGEFAQIVGHMHAGDVLRLKVLRFGRPTDISIRLDHRPLDLDEENRQQWLNVRTQAAEEYWKHEFSAIDPAAAPAPTPAPAPAPSSTQP